MSDHEKNPLKAIMRLKERSRSLAGEGVEQIHADTKAKKEKDAGKPAEKKNAGKPAEKKNGGKNAAKKNNDRPAEKKNNDRTPEKKNTGRQSRAAKAEPSRA